MTENVGSGIEGVASPELSVDGVLSFIAPGIDSPAWPPDAFAVAAYLLLKSTGYVEAVHRWPPPIDAGASSSGPALGSKEWVTWIETIGREWTRTAIDRSPAPPAVQGWWQQLRDAARSGTRVSEITAPELRPLCDALLQLCAAADEACAGVGDPTPVRAEEFWTETAEMIQFNGTLCERVHPSRVRVLPKFHTPQTGLTLRSLTHHLALCLSSDIQPKWHLLPFPKVEQRRLNLLLVPWPRQIRPRQFRALPGGPLRNLPTNFGFFTTDPQADGPSPEELAAYVNDLHASGEQLVDRIDAIVFPELALTEPQHDKVKEVARDKGCILITGVSVSPRPSADGESFGENYVAIDLPTASGSSGASPLAYVEPQHKHHRWRLDRPQILQYGLTSSLDPNMFWWEYIEVRDRCLSFVGINSWLTMCVLICEDLAREDPVAELVRAVGPNLVIALLMDGPQLKSRWSSRAAMVLADDPGSSVLTLTNWGFMQMCRPSYLTEASRVVALWNDPRTRGPRELEIEDGAEALLLTLGIDREEEWSADGRTDGRSTGYPFLGAVHQIRLPEPAQRGGPAGL